ncbi:sulfite exporter TauE/SafE family protein [Streptomyces sp. NPDC018057]|uniref:sulfite exporter TauE/SafE family protein n=1 Tax=unclassified Streptomyces TaxID=2593676 RepID=UPI0037B47BFF
MFTLSLSAPSVLLLLLFGCLTGVTTVLFGFGGGFVTVPVVQGVLSATERGGSADAMHVAIATSTAVMVVNAVSATAAQHRAGRIRREYVWPLAAYVLLGAVLGSLVATRLGDTLLHVLFAVYLLVTIADSVLRKGFLAAAGGDGGPRPLGRSTTTLGGVGIGTVAASLGVGGSVMTVPLLRRRGLPMATATALANPLSVPVALAGTLVYALAPAAPAHTGRVGYVDLVACAALLCGSLPTIAVARRLGARVPDRVHSVAYVALLVLVLAVTVAGGL